MNSDEFKALLKKRISELSYEQAFDLCLAVCKRLFFQYHEYAETYRQCDPDMILDGITMCQAARDKKPDVKEWQDYVYQLDDITPEFDETLSATGVYAMHACWTVTETMAFITTRRRAKAFEVACFLIDSTEYVVNMTSSDDLDSEQRDQHPSNIEVRNFLLELAPQKQKKEPRIPRK